MHSATVCRASLCCVSVVDTACIRSLVEMPRVGGSRRAVHEQVDGPPASSQLMSLPFGAGQLQLPAPLASMTGHLATLLPRSSNPTASGLKQALQASAVSVASSDWKATVLGAIELGGLLGAAGQLLQPQGPGGCDRSTCERCCNVATSFPYVVCGCHALRYRQHKRGKAWGASLCGVGVASAAFHGSWGKVRAWGRKADYWSIALSSNLMARAVFPQLPNAITALGLLAMPFKPFLVSTINTTAMELKFLHRARHNPKIRNAQRLHAACCATGLACFVLEEYKPEWPLIHSAWHCLSATAVSTINALLMDVEQNELGLVRGA